MPNLTNIRKLLKNNNEIMSAKQEASSTTLQFPNGCVNLLNIHDQARRESILKDAAQQGIHITDSTCSDPSIAIQIDNCYVKTLHGPADPEPGEPQELDIFTPLKLYDCTNTYNGSMPTDHEGLNKIIQSNCARPDLSQSQEIALGFGLVTPFVVLGTVAACCFFKKRKATTATQQPSIDLQSPLMETPSSPTNRSA